LARTRMPYWVPFYWHGIGPTNTTASLACLLSYPLVCWLIHGWGVLSQCAGLQTRCILGRPWCLPTPSFLLLISSCLGSCTNLFAWSYCGDLPHFCPPPSEPAKALSRLALMYLSIKKLDVGFHSLSSAHLRPTHSSLWYSWLDTSKPKASSLQN
jgi:hypothetical protein